MACTLYLAFVSLLILSCDGRRFHPRGEPEYPGPENQRSSTLKLRMPGATPLNDDAYICTMHKVDQEFFITQFRVEGTAERAHHMLLYGCAGVPVPTGTWDCGHHGVCAGSQSILFAWAKNAPPTSLPPNVGFRVGGSTQVKYLVLQIHYSHPLPKGEKDYSGMDLETTTQQQKYIAGIFLLLSGSTVIPPLTPKTHGDINCRFTWKSPIHMFAYRTHAHSLGRVITGYRLSNKTGKLEEIARGNPQWPQAFYGMSRVFDAENGDMLFARCTFDSSERNRTTYIGGSSGDEMCNLYIMYYTDAVEGYAYGSCNDKEIPSAMDLLPADSDQPLPPNPLLEEHALHGSQSNLDHKNPTVIAIGNRTSINLGTRLLQAEPDHFMEKMEYNLVDTGRTSTSESAHTLPLRMPGYTPSKNDDYRCVAFKMDQQESYITQFRVEGTADRAHHMLLFGCSEVRVVGESWDCGHHGSCSGNQIILFAWAKNAPPTSLPPNVGFQIGSKTRAPYLVLQIHYAHPLESGEKDFSGMDLEITTQPQRYIAGIYLLLTSSTIIPPHRPKVHGDINCRVRTKTPVHMFAYRTHAHALGKVITGYRYSNKTGQLEEIARGNPQWPQAFYGMTKVFDVEEDDILFGRCTFDSTHRDKTTYIGSTAGDEMCNLYLMYYTDAATGSPYESCADKEFSAASKILPADSDEPLPPNPLLEEHALHGNGHAETQGEEEAPAQIYAKEKENGIVPTPDKKGTYSLHGDGNHVHKKPLLELGDDYADENQQDDYDLKPNHQQAELLKTYRDRYNVDTQWSLVMQGQPSAVGIDSKGNVIVFHRGNRAWDANTFTFDNRLSNPQQGPIKQSTLMLLNPNDGSLINQAGGSMFYLPHGLTVDDHDQLWVTDVGAHQVFKLTPLTANSSSVQILIELGKQLQPGSGDGRFCKPTSVAVLPSGEFFVADGYCNSRIIKYNAAGIKITEWGEKPGYKGPLSPNAFNIPHSLTLINEREMVCVADRENGRVVCFSSKDGQYQMQLKMAEFGKTVYAIAYFSGNLYLVNGPSYRMDGKTSPAQGYVIDMKETGSVISSFGTKVGGSLGQPHWLAVGANGTSIYVADINPYRVVKFLLEGAVSAAPKAEMNKVESTTAAVTSKPHVVSEMSMADLDSVSFSTSLIILSIFTVPLLCILTVASIVRLRRRGCCGKNRGNQLDIGSLLGHRDPVRGGFEKLAMEDSDGDCEIDSDSDTEVVEFTKAKRNVNMTA